MQPLPKYVKLIKLYRDLSGQEKTRAKLSLERMLSVRGDDPLYRQLQLSHTIALSTDITHPKKPIDIYITSIKTEPQDYS